MSGMPFLFLRDIPCTDENGLEPNAYGLGRVRRSYVVKLTKYSDYSHYRHEWMDDQETFPPGCEVYRPDVDITETVFVYDHDDTLQSYQEAMAKMKELWASFIP